MNLSISIPTTLFLKSKTFEIKGISRDAATDYLNTPEGTTYLGRVIEADPSSSLETLKDRAITQITSNRELPRMELNSEPLVKIVPTGTQVSPYSPFFAKQSVVYSHNISYRFGLLDRLVMPVDRTVEGVTLRHIHPMVEEHG